jgi:hypothetical protein
LCFDFYNEDGGDADSFVSTLGFLKDTDGDNGEKMTSIMEMTVLMSKEKKETSNLTTVKTMMPMTTMTMAIPEICLQFYCWKRRRCIML